MLAYAIRRVIYTIPVLLGVAVLVFMLFHAVGEDPVRIALGAHATPESIAELRHQWGLDKPLPMQLLGFFGQIITFDYGVSYNSGEQLSEMFTQGAAVSLWLTVPPFLIGLVMNLGIGLLVAYYRGTWFDRFSTAVLIMTMSISYLVYIIGFQYFFAYRLEMFPINGYEQGLDGIKYLILPWIIILVVSAGEDVRMYRTMFLDETQADYVRTARAKGLSERVVVLKHVLRNALTPIITLGALELGTLLTGAVLTEQVFTIPGFGKLVVDAVFNRDYAVVQGVVMVTATTYIVLNLLADMAYFLVNPRLRT